jgi:multisubunit Na+/H+ antiporter MnhE subunit
MWDFPEPLFETFVDGKRLCLVCAKEKAVKALWTVDKSIVPVCQNCSADWNFYGYQILQRIRPSRLVLGILRYKLLHPLQKPSWPTIRQDIRGFQEWVRKMKRFMSR